MYNDPNCKPWNSRSWAPPGYSNRRDLVEEKRAAEAVAPIEKPTRHSSATGSAKYNQPDPDQTALSSENEKV